MRTGFDTPVRVCIAGDIGSSNGPAAVVVGTSPVACRCDN